MIKELYLKNWKSFSPSRIYIDPLTVLIGTNASGKSNLLDAFWFLSQIAKGRTVEYVFNEIRGGREWLIRKGFSEATLLVVLSKDIHGIEYCYEVDLKRADDKIWIAKESLKQIDHKRDVVSVNIKTQQSTISSVETTLFRSISDLTKPYVSVYSRRSKQGPDKNYQLSRTTSVLSQISSTDVRKEIKDGASFVCDELSNIFVLNPIPNNMRGYSKLSEILQEDASNMAGVLSAMEDEKRKNVEERLTNYLRGLPERDIKKVWTERFGPFNEDVILLCEEQWRGNEVTKIDSRSMSDGTLRFLAIATAIMTRPKGSLLIVEEIDNGLHPSRTSELIRMLKEMGEERSIDILCTTHNPVMIDELGVEMIPIVFFVKRDAKTGGSVVEPVEELSNLPKLLAQYTLGDLMTEGKL